MVPFWYITSAIFGQVMLVVKVLENYTSDLGK